jgi:predicted NUDIX family NTP pyrophosphohydrolase
MSAGKRSAGLLLFRRTPRLEVLLVHPGGPLYAKKDLGIWSVPKGEVEGGADELETAIREMEEETGLRACGPYLPLGEVRQKSGKTVVAWAYEGDCDPEATRSNTFRMEWPPKSGRTQEFPEVDRSGFFDLAEARRRINPAQVPFLDRLEAGYGERRGA